MPLTSRPSTSATKSKIRAGGIKGVQYALDSVKYRHRKITGSWSERKDRPDWKTKIKEEGNKILGYVFMKAKEAEDASISVWQLLERGTDIRYMMLSGDWVSKTWPGRLSSGSGGGRKLGLDTSDPQAGIDARNWTETVAEAQEVGTDTAIREGWKNGFRDGIGK